MMTSGAMALILGISNLVQGYTVPIESQQRESTSRPSVVGIDLAQGNGAWLNPMLERNSSELHVGEKRYEATLWLTAANLMEGRIEGLGSAVERPQPMKGDESDSYDSLLTCQHLQASLRVELETTTLDEFESGSALGRAHSESDRTYLEYLTKRSRFWGLSYAALEAGLFNALRSNTSIPKISIKQSEYWHVATNDSCNIRVDVRLIYLDDLHLYSIMEARLGYPYVLYADESWHRVTEPVKVAHWMWLGSSRLQERMSHPNIDKQLALNIERQIREYRCKDQDAKFRTYPCLPHR